jgi:hypothetical protein
MKEVRRELWNVGVKKGNGRKLLLNVPSGYCDEEIGGTCCEQLSMLKLQV